MKKFGDVRQVSGVPIAADFANSGGTPLVINIASGTGYYLNAAGSVQVLAGGAAGAPSSASYVTLALDAGLTAERTAAVTSPITLTDGGANNPVTWAFDQTVVLGNNARVAVTRNSAATISTRRKLNFIESGIITIGVVDDGAGEETEITIGAVGGGTTVISGAATVDFGNTPGVEDGVTTVTVASASVGAGSRFRVAPRYSSALTDHDADDYAAEGISAIIGTVTPGVGFDIIASANDATWGQYNIDWAYS